jgi:hypothetical protein
MEILRHHDVGQVLVHAAGRRFDLGDQGQGTGSRCGMDLVGGHFGGQLLRRRRDAGMFLLGQVHRVEHLLGGIAGLLGDVAQPAAGVRQPFGGLAQLGHHAELVQRVMQLPRDLSELLEHLRRCGRHRLRSAWFVHVCLPGRCAFNRRPHASA